MPDARFFAYGAPWYVVECICGRRYAQQERFLAHWRRAHPDRDFGAMCLTLPRVLSGPEPE